MVHAAAEHRQFLVRVAEDGVERAGLDLAGGARRGGRRAAEPRGKTGVHNSLGLPRLRVLQLLRKALGSAAARNASLPSIAETWCCP